MSKAVLQLLHLALDAWTHLPRAAMEPLAIRANVCDGAGR